MLPGLTRLKLLSAFQALTLPEGSNGKVTGYGVSHAEARKIIAEMLGMSVEDLPRYPPETEKTLEAYLANWLYLELA